MIKQCRTPTTNISGSCSLESVGKIAEGDWSRPSGSKKQLSLTDQIREPRLYPENSKTENIKPTHQLNPDWTEWLMGWPIGWTNLNPLSTEDFIKWFEMVLSGKWWDKDPANEGTLSRVTENKINRSRRIKALGNGQVPSCVVAATINLEKVNRRK